MPVFFSIEEVLNYIKNLNDEVIAKNPNVQFGPRVIEGSSERTVSSDEYFSQTFQFISTSTARDSKASNGPFNGEFNRFISRLENKINNNRLEFLLKPFTEDGNGFQTNDFNKILKQFTGYLNKSNISIIDLSGVPFEVLSITVSLVSRMLFDFSFHYSKLCHEKNETNNVPIMLVCEEAHNYLPQSDSIAYRSSRQSIERIAKEGRKYGLSLMVVSQRPSEVSSTIFSQCNNFLALRLTNSNDQNYVKSLLPNNNSSITDSLPTLASGECIVVGDATPAPSLVKIGMPNPIPASENVLVFEEWLNDWVEIDGETKNTVTLQDVLCRWRS
jgi:DNA helicase HerA-like ATPase